MQVHLDKVRLPVELLDLLPRSFALLSVNRLNLKLIDDC